MIENAERATGVDGAERADLARSVDSTAERGRKLLDGMRGKHCTCGRQATVARSAQGKPLFRCESCAAAESRQGKG